MKNHLLRYSLLFALLVFPAIVAADEIDDVKTRIKDRFSDVMSLKEQGLVGESNEGLLEPRGSLNSEQRRLLSDSNKDRGRLYELLAEKGSSSPSTIARYFARENAKRQPKGVWIQKPDGEWVRK